LTSVYLIAPGTRVAVSHNGSDFKPHKLRDQLQFDKPILITDLDMIFARDDWRIRVDRANVIVSRFGGGYAENQFGA
jgi:hypothetical protein